MAGPPVPLNGAARNRSGDRSAELVLLRRFSCVGSADWAQVMSRWAMMAEPMAAMISP
jgi:hypothetical protein